MFSPEDLNPMMLSPAGKFLFYVILVPLVTFIMDRMLWRHECIHCGSWRTLNWAKETHRLMRINKIQYCFRCRRFVRRSPLSVERMKNTWRYRTLRHLIGRKWCRRRKKLARSTVVTLLTPMQ